MSGVSDSLQVSQAVLGFSRRPPVRQVLAVLSLVAAVVSVAPAWWAHAVVSVARWPGRFWLVAVLASVALALLGGSRRRNVMMAVGRRSRTPAMPLPLHVALLLGVAAAVAVAVGALLWRVLGKPVVGAASGQPVAAGSAAPVWSASDTLDAVKVVLMVVGGVGAVVALAVAYRRQRLGEVAAYREDTKVLLDRFCKAAELLGSPDAAVRIAGVYAFAALANDAPEGRQGCIDVLCAYLRQPYSPPVDAGVGAGSAPHSEAELALDAADPAWALRDPRQERQVRVTIIRLIRDNLHLPDDDPRTWRGHDFNFCGAVFDGADFSGARFTGSGTVSFADATICGPLSFAGATFAGGVVSFDGARLAGGSVSFSAARFHGGVVDLSKIDDGPSALSASKLWPAGVPVPAGLRLPTSADRMPSVEATTDA
jgi:Pentapeptide repeats (9 copies)